MKSNEKCGSDAANIIEHVVEAYRVGHQRGDAPPVERRHNGFVTRHRERGEHQIGTHCLDRTQIQIQVAPQFGHAGMDLGRKIRIGVDAHQQRLTAQRTDDFGIRSGMADDAHGYRPARAVCTFLMPRV